MSPISQEQIDTLSKRLNITITPENIGEILNILSKEEDDDDDDIVPSHVSEILSKRSAAKITQNVLTGFFGIGAVVYIVILVVIGKRFTKYKTKPIFEKINFHKFVTAST